MAKQQAGTKEDQAGGNGENGGIVSLTKELFQAAITLRGSVEPADYKRYVLPIIFLRFLSLRYDRRRAELEALVPDKKSDYFESVDVTTYQIGLNVIRVRQSTTAS
jgi:type I restriction-modification system DNA methylase subunit